MSTYWGFVCESHDPPLESEHWFNHGDKVLIDLFIRERAGVWPVDTAKLERFPALGPEPMPVEHRGYVTTAPVDWLREHPRCSIALRNEYGDRRALPHPAAGSVGAGEDGTVTP